MTSTCDKAIRLKSSAWGTVEWAFTSTEPYYHPLPRLSHVLDYRMWGTDAAGHHATSVILHALNAALLFGFLWTLLAGAVLTTGERLAMALGIAVVFAIHPMQVESVSWLSCRTQLMGMAFGIGSLVGVRRWWPPLGLVDPVHCRTLVQTDGGVAAVRDVGDGLLSTATA